MAATISSAGTWSKLSNLNPTSQAPGAAVNEVMRQQQEGTEERWGPGTARSAAGIANRPDSGPFTAPLDYRNAFTADIDGQQEVMQFIGLMAANYAIPTGVALARIVDILFSQQTCETPEKQRVFAN